MFSWLRDSVVDVDLPYYLRTLTRRLAAITFDSLGRFLSSIVRKLWPVRSLL